MVKRRWRTRRCAGQHAGHGEKRNHHQLRAFAEMLEQRVMLSGVTIITHGWNSDAKSWIAEMGNAIARTIVAPAGNASSVAQYTLNAVAGSPVSIQAPIRDAGSADWGSSGEAIVKLDWGPLSGGLFSGTATGVVADAFADYLFSHAIDGHSIFEEPVHLIGHSRGASLNTQLARRLAQRGIWVDQFTSLDPHPVDGINEDLPGTNFGDTPMSLWSNTIFADNYWRSDSNAFDFNGESISGAVNVPLSDSVLEGSGSGYSYSHQYVHLWYHGTIGPQTAPFVPYPTSDGSASIGNNWYTTPHPAKETSGFRNSLIAGGQRPTGGIGSIFGGSGVRSSVTREAGPGTQWPNIDKLSLRHHPTGTLSQSERIFVSYRYQDFDSSATVSLFADTDSNPHNPGSIQFTTAQNVTSTGSGVATGLYQASVSNIPAGTWQVYARIADADGHTRYAYLPGTVAITSAAPVPTIVSNQTKNDSIGVAGEADVYSFNANTGDTFTLAMGTSGFGARVDLYGPNGTLIGFDSSNGSAASLTNIAATLTGIHYVVARASTEGNTGTYTMTLAVTPPLSSFMTNSADVVFLRRNLSDSSRLDAWINTASPGQDTPSTTVRMSDVSSLSLLGGDDQLTLDFANGSPLAASTALDGAAGTDAIIVLGTAGQQAIAFGAGTISLGSLTHSNMESVTFDGKGGDDIVIVNAGQVGFSDSQRFQSLTVEAGAMARLTSGGDIVLVTKALTINGTGKLDLADNELIIDYTSVNPAGSWNGSSYTGTYGLIASGRNGGTWDGSGIVTTMSDAPTGLTTLGVALAGDVLGIGQTDTAVWEGQTVDGTTVLVKYTYAGDADLNGLIDGNDYGYIDFGAAVPGTDGYGNGDFNYDGVIDGNDYGYIDFNILTQGAPL